MIPKGELFKFNGGHGAILCAKCSTMVCAGIGLGQPIGTATSVLQPDAVWSLDGSVYCCEAHADTPPVGRAFAPATKATSAQVFHAPVKIGSVDGDTLRIEHIESTDAYNGLVAIIDMPRQRMGMWRPNREQLQQLRDECDRILGVPQDIVDALPSKDELRNAMCVTNPPPPSERVHQLVLSRVAPFVNALRGRIAALEADAEAWRKGHEVLRELRERVIPCGHKVEDLIGGEGSVTKCGACLAAKQKKHGA